MFRPKSHLFDAHGLGGRDDKTARVCHSLDTCTFPPLKGTRCVAPPRHAPPGGSAAANTPRQSRLLLHHAEMENGRFLRENALFQRTTPHHVILNAVKDLSETHRIGKPGTVSINDRFFAFGSE